MKYVKGTLTRIWAADGTIELVTGASEDGTMCALYEMGLHHGVCKPLLF